MKLPDQKVIEILKLFLYFKKQNSEYDKIINLNHFDLNWKILKN